MSVQAGRLEKSCITSIVSKNSTKNNTHLQESSVAQSKSLTTGIKHAKPDTSPETNGPNGNVKSGPIKRTSTAVSIQSRSQSKSVAGWTEPKLPFWNTWGMTSISFCKMVSDSTPKPKLSPKATRKPKTKKEETPSNPPTNTPRRDFSLCYTVSENSEPQVWLSVPTKLLGEFPEDWTDTDRDAAAYWAHTVLQGIFNKRHCCDGTVRINRKLMQKIIGKPARDTKVLEVAFGGQDLHRSRLQQRELFQVLRIEPRILKVSHPIPSPNKTFG